MNIIRTAIDAFLSEPGGEHRATSITTACLRIVMESFNEFAWVESRSEPATDTDKTERSIIECPFIYAEDRILEILVLDRSIIVLYPYIPYWVDSYRLGELLGLTMEAQDIGDEIVDHRVQEHLYTGENVYRFDTADFIATLVKEMPKRHRTSLLLAIGREFDRDPSHGHSRAWRYLLTALLISTG